MLRQREQLRFGHPALARQDHPLKAAYLPPAFVASPLQAIRREAGRLHYR
jgi:hypothetical protein